MTLNSGFQHQADSSKDISDEERQMIEDYLLRKGASTCPPADLKGSELPPHTHERIMQKRKEFRDKARSKNK